MKELDGRPGNKEKDLQGEEDKDFGPDTGMMIPRVDTECFECSEDNEESRPPMVKREGKVDEELVRVILRVMELLHDVIDVLGKVTQFWS